MKRNQSLGIQGDIAELKSCTQYYFNRENKNPQMKFKESVFIFGKKSIKSFFSLLSMQTIKMNAKIEHKHLLLCGTTRH